MRGATRRRVASNTAVQVAGKAVVLVFGATSLALLTRYLGTEDYGRYGLALMYVQLFGVLADVGLFTIVVREIAKDPRRTDELVGNALTLRLLLGLGTIALAAGVSLLLPYPPSVRTAILLAGGPLLLGMLTTSFVAVLQARLRMARAVIGDVVGRGVALAAVGVVVALDLGFYAVLVAASAGALATLVVTVTLTRGLAGLRPRADLRLWRTLLAASLPLGVALAINQVYVRVDTLIISLYEPFEQVGFYTLAYRVLELTLVVGSVFLNSVLPVLSAAVVSDPVRTQRIVRDALNVLVALGAPVVAGGLVLAPEIVELAGGPDFAGAADPLRILLVAAALIWVNGVFGAALIAKERQLSALWLNVAALIFNVGLNLLLVPRYGIVVAAVVTVASELVILVGSSFLMRRYLGFVPLPATLVPAVVAAAAMAGVLLALGGVPLALLLLAGAVAYGALLYALSPTSRRLIAELRP